MNWLLIAFSFWVIDRLLRVVALAWRNIALRSLCSGRVSHANVRQIAPDLYELSISLVRHWQFVEGQYVFLHLPGGFNWLQSHPFSILDYSNADSSELGNLAAEPRPLRILARSKLGITKGFKAFSARPAIPVLLEGPYGPSWSLPLDDFDNITFVSGGVGFAAVFAFAKRAGSRGRHKKLHLVLVVRTSAEYHGLLPYLDEVHPSVWRSIFITEPSVIEAHPTSEETSLLTISEEYHPAVSTVTSRGRPSLHNLLCEDAEGKGSFAVVACGP